MTGPETALVFGATGFFGSHIADRLEAEGAAVTRLGSSGPDFTDADQVRAVVASEKPGLIVAAAGLASPRKALEDPPGCFALNTGGVFGLLEAVRTESSRSHVVAISSAAVYSGEPPFTESSPVSGTDPYSASKLAMELLCHQYRSEGMKIAVVRSFNLIGPGEPSIQITSELVRAAASAGPRDDVEVEVADAGIGRDFTDVLDAAEAIHRISTTGAKGTFNLCSGSEVSLAKLADVVSQVSGVKVNLVSNGHVNPTGKRRSWGSPELLRQATGWRAVVPIERSVQRLFQS